MRIISPRDARIALYRQFHMSMPSSHMYALAMRSQLAKSDAIHIQAKSYTTRAAARSDKYQIRAKAANMPFTVITTVDQGFIERHIEYVFYYLMLENG